MELLSCGWLHSAGNEGQAWSRFGLNSEPIRMTSDELKQLKALQLPLGTRSAKAAHTSNIREHHAHIHLLPGRAVAKAS